jgi:hypothetical protein
MIGTLLDPNYSTLITPTIISPNYMYCTVSITMTITKFAAVITDGFVDFVGILNS